MTPPLRLGLIGAGSSTAMYGPALRCTDGAVLCAAADPREEAAHTVAEVWGDVPVFPSTEEMYAAVDLDAVLIASPPVRAQRTRKSAPCAPAAQRGRSMSVTAVFSK